MATTVASIALQLLLFGTVVQLSYEIECHHTYRAVGHKFGQPLPAEFKKILEVDWEQPDISKKDGTRSCWEGTGCVTLRCVGANEVDLFRINGCLGNNKCLDTFKPNCGKRKGTWKCEPCQGEKCNGKLLELKTTTPEPVTNATSSAITAMPSTHIGTSAKLVVAAIVNAALLMMIEWRNDDDDEEEEEDDLM
ncbi:hypothetical protein niasHT_025847 [Heterodera trifolii]|uniref:Uncharacterized protein n=1 Tax=Heterodera trifolii TaxID=157864 RepID=A0ABD2KKH4_9BILA